MIITIEVFDRGYCPCFNCISIDEMAYKENRARNDTRQIIAEMLKPSVHVRFVHSRLILSISRNGCADQPILSPRV